MLTLRVAAASQTSTPLDSCSFRMKGSRGQNQGAIQKMFLREVVATVDCELAERFPPSCVGRFFNEETCVTWPFSQLIHRTVQTIDDWKVCIVFSDQFPTPCAESQIHPMALKYPFDFEAYIHDSAFEKKRRILKGTTDACVLLAQQRHWNSDAFQIASESLLKVRFCFPFRSKKTWRSPDRRLIAQIVVEMDLDVATAYLCVTDKRSENEPLRIQFLETTSGPIAVALEEKLAKSAGWQNNDEFRIVRGTKGIGRGITTYVVHVASQQAYVEMEA